MEDTIGCQIKPFGIKMVLHVCVLHVCVEARARDEDMRA